MEEYNFDFPEEEPELQKDIEEIENSEHSKVDDEELETAFKEAKKKLKNQ
jgi:hypothetical protein